jgi:hypothetical protein
MNIEHGFLLESPRVAVPWGISQTELAALIKTGLRKITVGYFTLPCTSLPGLTHNLGLHFEPRSGGRLVEIEFFSKLISESQFPFENSQKHLKKNLGRHQRLREAIMAYRHTMDRGDRFDPSFHS